ncbi:MAG: amidohydrolase family protein [Chlamydiota bacterium]|nr:amidohydrolase family protein [Chlamydiota bacterium]
MPSIFIRNVSIVDGSGKPPYLSNVLVQDQYLTIIPVSESAPAEQIIDGTGLFLCPGFIDIHGHSDHYLGVAPEAESKIFQGVTTEIFGNCGYSPFFNRGPFKKHFCEECNQLGITNHWSNLSDFSEWIKTMQPAINYGTFAGHGTLRSAVMGRVKKDPDKNEMRKMIALFRESLDQGAFGLSTGLPYIPGCFANSNEIIQLLLSTHDDTVIYATHMRSEGETLIESIQESITIAKKSTTKLQISHLKTSGRKNWHKINSVFEMLDRNSMDLDIAWDRYPYTASCTSLDICLPDHLFDRGEESALDEIKSTRKAIESYLMAKEKDLSETLIIGTMSEHNKDLSGLTLQEAAGIRHKTIAATLLDLLIEERFQVSAIFFSMSEENMERIICHPKTIVASDASARTKNSKTFLSNAHPRTYGTFPRFIKRFVLDHPLLSLENAIHRITGLPAMRIGLKKRGFIQDGYYADLVLLDLASLSDHATYQQPTQTPSGIVMVMVNGSIAVEKGLQSKTRSGVFIKKNDT